MTNYLAPYSEGIIVTINGILVPVLMAIAFIAFLWGMYKYFILGAADDASRVDGRKFTLWGIIGFVIILSLWGIVNLIMGTLGLSIGTVPAFPVAYTPTENEGNPAAGTNGGYGSSVAADAALTQQYSSMQTICSTNGTSSTICQQAQASYVQNYRIVYPSSTFNFAAGGYVPPPSGYTPPQNGTTGTSSPPVTPAQLTKKPAGIYCLPAGDTVARPFSISKLNAISSWTDPNVDGISVRSWWNKIEPTQGSQDWSFIDESVRLAQANKKSVSLSIMAGINTPTWVLEKGVESLPVTITALTADRTVSTQYVPYPWDPVFLGMWGPFIKEMGNKYDGNPAVAYVHMNGFGFASEAYLARSASEISAFNAAGGITKWIEGTKKIIDMYVAAFPTTPLVIALAPPTLTKADGDTAMEAVTAYGMERYPGHFGITHHGLNALSTDSFLPNRLILSHSANSPVGFQMVWATVGENSTWIRGTLAQSLANADALKAHFVEVYLQDCANATYATTLEQYSGLFKKNAGIN